MILDHIASRPADPEQSGSVNGLSRRRFLQAGAAAGGGGGGGGGGMGEQNDISHLYGVYIKEAGQKLGWDVTVIDGKGSPTSWLAGMNQAIALKHGRLALAVERGRVVVVERP